VGGVGRIGLVIAVITLCWNWLSVIHATEHHPVGRERGGSAAKSVAAVGNRTTFSSTSRCAITAHVVQAPEPLQQQRSERTRAAYSQIHHELLGKREGRVNGKQA
jgi:hypothetical protein